MTEKPASARSFREIYDAEVGYVGRVLVRFGAATKDLDDLVQEVFLVVYRRRGDYDASRPLRPWLCGIAFRVATAWRRRAFQREVSTDSHDVATTDVPADRKLAAHQTVQRGLSALSFDHRTVLVLCDMEGHTATEAAALLEIPVGTVYSRLHEARRGFMAAVPAPESAR